MHNKYTYTHIRAYVRVLTYAYTEKYGRIMHMYSSLITELHCTLCGQKKNSIQDLATIFLHYPTNR